MWHAGTINAKNKSLASRVRGAHTCTHTCACGYVDTSKRRVFIARPIIIKHHRKKRKLNELSPIKARRRCAPPPGATSSFLINARFQVFDPPARAGSSFKTTNHGLGSGKMILISALDRALFFPPPPSSLLFPPIRVRADSHRAIYR